jgi:hypothetical protein
MTGATSHKVTIGIIDLTDRQNLQPRYLDLGDVTDRYFTNISWAPDGKSLYLIELNRDQNESHLDAYDVVTGKKKATLFTERDEKYVEPLHPITFLPWDDSKYIYWSQKDGFWHLYLGSLNDKKGKKADLIQLTKGEWVVMSIIGFCEKDKSVIISANKEVLKKIDREAVTTGAFGLNKMGIAATRAAYTYGAPWLTELLKYIEGNVALLREELKNTDLIMMEPEGTYLVWVDCSSHKNFAMKLLKDAHVRVSEGSFFGEGGENFIRINVACPRSVLKEAIKRMKAVL